MTLRQAKDTAISHNAIIELQEDEHNGFAHTVWKGVFHQLPKEYLDREFKPITDYVHYEKQYECPIIIELKRKFVDLLLFFDFFNTHSD